MAPVPRPGSDAPTPWREGWYAPAQALPSPNRGARPEGTSVSLIVVHSISLPPGEFGGTQVQALFTNTLDWDAHPYFQGLRGLQVSAHFFIRRDGALWQFVSTDERAWHAGASCHRACANCNDYSVGIELEGLEGGVFEAAQYAGLARLCQDLRRRYPIDAIAGHEHIAPGRKLDPGPGFDWRALQRTLHWPRAFYPDSVLG